MTIGKIKGTQTFQQSDKGRLFSGMDVEAEFLNKKGKTAELTFHYSYFTNDLRGQVERVLSHLESGKTMPEEYTKVEVK